MSVYFSEKFKQLRKDNDLTQEEIADIFHVSPKCVSRWETGANYPDVEMLPHIAIYFKVTLDELLGIEEVRSEEKVNDYTKDIRNLLNSGRLNDAIELARKAIKEYPVAGHGLHYLLLQALRTDGSEKHKEEIIILGERITTTDPNNWGVKWQLVEQYAAWGMKEEAQKILDTMPEEIWHSREVWQGCILEGEEWKRNQKVRIVRTYVLLDYFIGGYIRKAGLGPLEKIEYGKISGQIGKLLEPITSDSASSFHDAPETKDYLDSAFGNIGNAELYCEAGADYTENALDCVEKATQDALYHIEHMDTTNADGSNYMAWSTPRNLPWIIWEDYLMKPCFDIVRNDERFIKCLELLKSNSRELKQ